MVMKFKIFFIIIFSLSFLLYSEEIKYTADNMTVSLDENGEIEKIYLEGNITIFYKNIIFKAQKATYDRKKNQIECEGNVEIISDEDKLNSDYLEYSISEETIIIKNAKFKIDQFFGKTENLVKSGKIYKFENGYFTTCELEKPHYRISAGKIEFLKDEYLKLERFQIVFGDKFKIFYFPRFTIDLETMKPFFVPVIGYKTKTGTFLEFNFNLRPFEKKDFILNNKIFVGTKGTGLGFGIHSDKYNLNFKTYAFKKYDENEVEPGGYIEFSKKFEDIDLIIDWRWMKNDEFFCEFFRDEFLNKSKMYNYFYLTGKIGNGLWSLNLRENANENILNVEKLPELRYFLPYFQISKIPLFFSYDFRLTNFDEEKVDTIRILNKWDLTHKKDFNFFTLKPYISFSSINYLNTDPETFNYIGETGLSLSTIFWDLNKNIYFIPEISVFKRWTRYEPEYFTKFDEFENKKSGEFISTNLRWNVNLEKNFSGYCEIRSDYAFTENTFENLLFKYEFEKKDLKFEGENEWDTKNGIYRFGTNTVSYEKERFKFSLGTRRDIDAKILGFESWLQQTLRNDWNYRIGLFFDYKSKELFSQSYEIWKKIHCLVVDFRFTKDKENISFYFFIMPSIFFENNWQRRFTKWK